LSVIVILIGFSLLVALIFLIAFLWAVKNGQYEDRYTPSVRILFDDKDESENLSNNKTNEKNKVRPKHTNS
jgi:cbb3-type cytochrome oxidase maturation protein